MATKTEKNVQLKINKMTKNIFDQLSVQGLISEDELYLLSDDETGSATWGTIGGELSNQNDLKVMLDSKADKSEIPTVNNPTITFTQGNAVKGSITLNQANDQTISLDAGGGGGGGGGGSGDYVPLSTDIAGNKTAATIGTRNNGVLFPNRPKPIQLSAIGANTFTVGTDCAALSANSFAQGLSCVARGTNSIALGRKVVAGFDNTFVWSGDDSPFSEVVESVGPGTFNIFNTAAPDTDILFINGKKLTEIVGGGESGDDIYCKYGSTSEDPPGWNFMSIATGQTYIDYSQINNITNNSSKPSKIVGYFEFTQADSQDYEIIVGTSGNNYNNNVSFVWKGNTGSNGNIKVPFIIVYNPIESGNYIQVNGGWNIIYMHITAIYNGGQMKGSFQ